MSEQNGLYSAARSTGLSGEITYLTGQTRSFSGERAISFSRSEGVGDGMLLGGALSASFQLTLDNADSHFTFPFSPYGAQARILLTEGEDAWPLGVFIVSQVSQSEENGHLTLSGSDAMGTAFEAEWTDDLYYPLTLGALVETLANRVGFTCRDDFPGRSAVIHTPPDWGDITVRKALAYTMQAAGCFAMISPEGTLAIRTVWPGETSFSIPVENTFSRALGDGIFGPLQGISVTPYRSKRDTLPVIVKEEGAVLTGQNCLYISGNPLFPLNSPQTDSLAFGLFRSLRGMDLSRIRVQWSGDPTLLLGSRITSRGPGGSAVSTQITRQSLTFDRGFSMQSDCTVSRSVSTVGRLFTSSGALNASMLQGQVDGRNIQADTIAASAILAGSITARQLAAASVTTEKLAADVGEMMEAKIGNAQISAAQIQNLAAEVARIAQAEIQEAHLEAAQIDDLASAIARVLTAQIGTASINFAQIKDAVTQNLITKDAVADKYFIQKLQVQNLQVISQTVDNLVVKAADGNYYTLSVDGNGAVTAQQTTVTASEIASGVTQDGQRSIIETDLLASELTATNIKGANALIDKIAARRINVDSLFAREAFIGKLLTTDISGNGYLQLMVDGKIDDMVIGGRNYLRNSGDLNYKDYRIQYLSGDPAAGYAVVGETAL